MGAVAAEFLEEVDIRSNRGAIESRSKHETGAVSFAENLRHMSIRNHDVVADQPPGAEPLEAAGMIDQFDPSDCRNIR